MDNARLVCLFFEATCRRVLAGFFEREGFKEDWVTPLGGIVFRRGAVFVEVEYEAESRPRYVPTILIGIGSGKFGEGGRICAVPFWFVIDWNLTAAGAMGRAYSAWTFGTALELETVLIQIRETILETHGRALWGDTRLLAQCVERFSGRAGATEGASGT